MTWGRELGFLLCNASQGQKLAIQSLPAPKQQKRKNEKSEREDPPPKEQDPHVKGRGTKKP